MDKKKRKIKVYTKNIIHILINSMIIIIYIKSINLLPNLITPSI